MRSEEQIREVRDHHQISLDRNRLALTDRLKHRNITSEEYEELSKDLDHRREIVRTLSWVLEEYYSETLT